MTRLRAAKESSASPAVERKPSGLMAMGKEGFRKVSDKMKDKDREKDKEVEMEKERNKRKAVSTSKDPSHAETLQVSGGQLIIAQWIS